MNLPVKPLVWKNETGRHSYPHRYRAVTPIAEYSVVGAEGRANWQYFRNGFYCGADSRVERGLEDAMNAAFAHHVALLTSCMDGTE